MTKFSRGLLVVSALFSFPAHVLGSDHIWKVIDGAERAFPGLFKFAENNGIDIEILSTKKDLQEKKSGMRSDLWGTYLAVASDGGAGQFRDRSGKRKIVVFVDEAAEIARREYLQRVQVAFSVLGRDVEVIDEIKSAIERVRVQTSVLFEAGAVLPHELAHAVLEKIAQEGASSEAEKKFERAVLRLYSYILFGDGSKEFVGRMTAKTRKSLISLAGETRVLNEVFPTLVSIKVAGGGAIAGPLTAGESLKTIGTVFFSLLHQMFGDGIGGEERKLENNSEEKIVQRLKDVLFSPISRFVSEQARRVAAESLEAYRALIEFGSRQ